MSELRRLTDRTAIYEYLRRNVPLHIYQIGDLDDFFWPHTEWWGWPGGDTTEALALIYHAQFGDTLIALDSDNHSSNLALLRALRPALPRRFYAHLSPGLEVALAEFCDLNDHGLHLKMHATSSAAKLGGRSCAVDSLTIEQTREIEEFYRAAYPGNWFDPRMLATGMYFGARDNGRLTAAGGVHVYSPQYQVAAIGNVATLPEYRGRGLATAVTQAIMRALAPTITAVGLNVNADNAAAIACYRKLGFVDVAYYRELSASKRDY